MSGAAIVKVQGDVLVTPDAIYTGVMIFKYKVQDAQGNFSEATNTATGQSEAMKAAVYLQTPDLPTDSLAMQQWCLADSNVLAVWKDYSGKGVASNELQWGMVA